MLGGGAVGKGPKPLQQFTLLSLSIDSCHWYLVYVLFDIQLVQKTFAKKYLAFFSRLRQTKHARPTRIHGHITGAPEASVTFNTLFLQQLYSKLHNGTAVQPC